LSYKNANESYRKQKVMTASRLELVVMLYDGVIKNVTIGKRAIEKRDVQAAHDKLTRAQEIVSALMESLDLTISMSKELVRLYDYLLHAIGDANMKKDAAALDPVLEMLAELRGVWKQIADMPVDALSANAEDSAPAEPEQPVSGQTPPPVQAAAV
jgi:flagellar protein FliS